MLVEFNINDTCSVKLTEDGAKHLNRQQHYDAIQYKQGDRWVGKFHELMLLFGDYDDFNNGMAFDMNNITLVV